MAANTNTFIAPTFGSGQANEGASETMAASVAVRGRSVGLALAKTDLKLPRRSSSRAMAEAGRAIRYYRRKGKRKKSGQSKLHTRKEEEEGGLINCYPGV